MKSIGIVGLGFVGTAVREGLKSRFRVEVYDRDPAKQTVKSIYDLVYKTDGPIFVCVPTPMRRDGSSDTSIVERVVGEIDRAVNQQSSEGVVVIKSTVPPGTSERIQLASSHHLGIVFNPEFLTEANSIRDFVEQTHVVLGGTFEDCNVVADVYHAALPHAAMVLTSTKAAEMLKYVANTFLALKVAFANEVKLLCDVLDMHYDDVRELVLLDERLGKTHWKVPGPDGRLGFGGSCFPKDVNALINTAFRNQVEMRTLKAAWETNLALRPDRDWEALKGRAVSDDGACGFVPPTPGYAGCTREQGHDGPCAHPLEEGTARKGGVNPSNTSALRPAVPGGSGRKAL